MASESEQARRAAGGSVTEMGTGWVAPLYLLSLRGQLAGLPDGPERFALLRKAAGDVVALQLAGVWAGRLRVEQQKLEFFKQKHQDMLEIAKVEAAKLPEAKGKRDPLAPMSDEELKACVDKVDEIMGIKQYAQRVRQKEMEVLEGKCGVRSAECGNIQQPTFNSQLNQ
jgi:hypothetical protein